MTTIEPTLTIKQAATWFHRSESAIWMWVNRGHLKAVGRRGRTKLYRFADLVNVERKARHKANTKDLGNSSPEMPVM